MPLFSHIQIEYQDTNDNEPWSGQAIEYYRRSRIATRKRWRRLLFLSGGLLAFGCVITVVMMYMPKLFLLLK